MDVLASLRHAARMTARNPLLSSICIVTLGVGIGLTTAMFSIVNGVLLRGVPFEDATRIAAVVHHDIARGWTNMRIRLDDLEAYREAQRSFESLAAYRGGTFNVTYTGGREILAERHQGVWLSADAFDVLRVRPLLGRTFAPGEDAAGAEPVVVIGYRIWQDRFGGDPGAIGRTLRINGETATIIGVMPDGFLFPEREMIWMADRRDPAAWEAGSASMPTVAVFGRLRPGVSLDQASAELYTLSARQAELYAERNRNVRAGVLTLHDHFLATLGEQVPLLLYVMLAGIFGVLLIACVNVANLLLGNVALRSREVAIRTALGASRARLITQFLAEPLVLAVAGAALGIPLAAVLARMFGNAIPPEDSFFWMQFGVDRNVLLFVLALALLSALLSGLFPALRASARNLSETLKDESRGASSLRSGRMSRSLVVAEIALSVVLLVGAGLITRSVVNMMAGEVAFDQENVFTARLGLPEQDERYASAPERVAFFEQLEARLATLPGVRAASLTSALPGMFATSMNIAIDGRVYDRPEDRPSARYAVVSPGFFETFDAHAGRGRVFGAADFRDAVPVAIVNQSFAERHFPSGDAVGARISIGDAAGAPQRTIVGVVPDLNMSGARNEMPEGVYIPLAQSSERFMTIALRTAGPPMAVTPHVRAAVGAIEPDVPLYWVTSLADALHQLNWAERLFGGMFLTIGLVALFLAAIGLYAVVSAAVNGRRREMGIRMALGARSTQVLRMVLRQGAVQLAIGLAIGFAAALAVTGALSALLYGLGPRDPATFVMVGVVLVVTGLIATWVPARRATRVDPLVAFRAD